MSPFNFHFESNFCAERPVPGNVIFYALAERIIRSSSRKALSYNLGGQAEYEKKERVARGEIDLALLFSPCLLACVWWKDDCARYATTKSAAGGSVIAGSEIDSGFEICCPEAVRNT